MISIYKLNEYKEWDAAVKSFKGYDVYYLSGYVKGFYIHGDGVPLLFYYEDKNCRGINVVMKREINIRMDSETLYDLSTPYGYGGWLIEGEKTDELFAEYEKWCSEHNVISEFVRFHPMLSNQDACMDSYDVIPLGMTVAMDLSSPETIWDNLTSKNRNMIRKAIKNDVKIYNGRFPEVYESFLKIYNSTMDKDSAETYYYFESEFYQSILEDMAQNAQVFFAQIPDGTVIASSIIIGANGYLNYHLSGFVQSYGNLAATNLLLYKAALWGCENGYRTLYLGGGVGSGEDNLFKFKQAFYRGDHHRFYIGKKVFDKNRYDELVSLRKLDTQFDVDSSYFPLYRA